jgi:formate dehydrogenase gamma subunit
MARIEHAILMISFTILTITGLPQKYAQTATGEAAIGWMGGIELVRQIHRYAAFMLVIGTVYHLFTSGYRTLVWREKNRMLPQFKDVTDFVDTMRHNVGLIDEPPKMAKFNFGEKIEYWAVVWGTGVMILTGFMLWNPIATTAILPGQIIPAALAAHGGEALLAALSIIIWHMYNVHIKHFNASMFTGKLTRKQMEEEHALELERLDQGGLTSKQYQIDPRRQRIYLVASTVIGLALLVVLIWAFTFEQTAITTLPRVTPVP